MVNEIFNSLDRLEAVYIDATIPDLAGIRCRLRNNNSKLGGVKLSFQRYPDISGIRNINKWHDLRGWVLHTEFKSVEYKSVWTVNSLGAYLKLSEVRLVYPQSLYRKYDWQGNVGYEINICKTRRCAVPDRFG